MEQEEVEWGERGKKGRGVRIRWRGKGIADRSEEPVQERLAGWDGVRNAVFPLIAALQSYRSTTRPSFTPTDHACHMMTRTADQLSIVASPPRKHPSDHARNQATNHRTKFLNVINSEYRYFLFLVYFNISLSPPIPLSLPATEPLPPFPSKWFMWWWLCKPNSQVFLSFPFPSCRKSVQSGDVAGKENRDRWEGMKCNGREKRGL
ncbi:hypothetical protein P152DRAFT_288014 [Eremomyces bilateralis CBS 781.70]|uniref:Uncharacterized protein n=1 Tax=Eremomyces bilateralis CBS 781.70 TaxID=1392243 RepID=A0A6G1G6K2_9PEZI|nr:uncharacterized protein P152DRAFT_288014 [Eremomyces bilateralis CBS 781.70]KAF1813668.1 hypothetical protein P152DRAFT_288014 [Eremomyces bilateralis CBS 781.70]